MISIVDQVGGCVDRRSLEYLAKHNIDRNLVSQELSRAFSEMVYIHGCECAVIMHRPETNVL